jgi:hypothetical protein
MHALAMHRRLALALAFSRYVIAGAALLASASAPIAVAAELPELPAAAMRGREIYRNTCMRCHESDPMRDRPGSAARIQGGVATAIEVIPSMRSLQTRLTTQDVADVQAWLDVVVLLPGSLRPATGWFVDPTAPGRALFHEVGGGHAVLITFQHADDGRPEWRRILSPYSGARAGVKAALVEQRDGQGLVGPWRPAQPDPAPLPTGAGFAEAGHIGLVLPRSSLRYARHAFAGSPTPTPPNSGFPQAGLWWNRDEPGRGFALEVQADRLLIVAYFFDEIGRATWLVSTGAMTSATQYAGRWQRAIGGPTIEPSLRKFAPSTADAGPLAITFDSPRRAVLTLPDGRALPIERLH